MTSRISKTMALAALMASAAGGAYATEGWYGRLDVGYSTDGSIDIGDTDYDFDNDWSEYAGLGYAFPNSGFRLEGEISHRYNDFGEDEGLLDGNVHAWAAMFNAYYDFNRGGSIEPYVGVGIGGARLNASANNGISQFTNAEDTVLAYQAMVGLAIGLGEQWDVDIGYRY